MEYVEHMENISFNDMEEFVLCNSKRCLRVRREIEKVAATMQLEDTISFQEHGVKFDITKHTEDSYDINIVDDRTYLTEDQIQELYDTMYSTMVERNPDDDRLSDMHLEIFKQVYLKNRANDYIDDGETMDFYSYVEDHIYDTVCYQ